MKYQRFRIRDPLHNIIEFNDNQFDNMLWRVIQTEPFQRLRRIKQLGFSDHTYPGATHSRFAHSVGVLNTARSLIDVIRREKRQHIENNKVEAALAAALVHDIGHGPFSHAFEDVGRRKGLKLANHETVSSMLIRDSEVSEVLNSHYGGFSGDVAGIISESATTSIYGSVVSSQFDADRLDYMRRDRLMCGTGHGAIDFEWLIANLEIGSVPFGEDAEQYGEVETFVLNKKAIFAAESYVLGLFQLYPAVYFHKATRCIEKMFTEMMCALVDEILDGSLKNTGLSRKHPIVQFAKNPDKIENVISLDDCVVWGALPMLEKAENGNIARLAGRLRKRKLYKCFDIREEILARILNSDCDRAEAISRANVLSNQVFEKIVERNQEKSHGESHILTDSTKRAPYKRFTQSKGPLNQIRIRSEDGSLSDLRDHSEVVRSIGESHVIRAYVSGEQDGDLDFIKHTVESVCNAPT